MSLNKKTSLLNLTKENLLNLTKEDYSLKNLEFNLSWDSIYDLDLIALLIDKNDNIHSTVHYDKKNDKGISLSEKKTFKKTNESNLKIDFSNLPLEVYKINIFIAVFNEIFLTKPFKAINNPRIKVTDTYEKNIILNYSLKEKFPNFKAIHLCDLTSHNNRNWKLTLTENGLKNSSLDNLTHYCLNNYIEKKIDKIEIATVIFELLEDFL